MQEHAPACGRENDLIAFLYDELGDAEKNLLKVTCIRAAPVECRAVSSNQFAVHW